MELAKGVFYHIHTPCYSPSQAPSISRFLFPRLAAYSLFLLAFLKCCICPFIFTSKSLPSFKWNQTSCMGSCYMSVFISLSIHHRGRGHPEGDEREGRGVERHTRHHVLSHAQRRGDQRRHRHHPTPAGHPVHPRTGQAHRQPLLAPDYCLPGQVKQTKCFVLVD